MNLRMPRLAALLALVTLPACMGGGQCAETCALSTKDRAAIQANAEAWLKAVRAADWAAVAATYTTDAILLPPNQPVVAGRDKIRAWFAGFPPIVSMDIEDTEVDGHCDLAYARGTYRLTIAPPGAPQVRETGKYIEIRRKQADGTWLKQRDMFSSDAAAPH